MDFKKPFCAIPVEVGDAYRRSWSASAEVIFVALLVFGAGMIATNWDTVAAAFGALR